MAVAADRGKRRRSSGRRKKSRGGSWLLWWPLLVGVLVTPLAVHAASILALTGPFALRMLYPFVVLVKSPVLGLRGDLGNSVSQWMMYLQFPLYGLLMALILRFRRFFTALASVVFLHAAAFVAVLLLAHGQSAS